MTDTTIWIVVIALLQAADAYLTAHILKHDGRELNPVMDWVFDRIGVVPGLIITKTLFVAGLIAIVPYAPIYVYVVIAIAYVGLVIWNVSEYRKIK